ATLASETNVPGHRRSWISSLETALGWAAIRTSSNAKALGERPSARLPRKTSRVPESKTQSPNARRIRTTPERNREKPLESRDDFPLRGPYFTGVPPSGRAGVRLRRQEEKHVKGEEGNLG